MVQTFSQYENLSKDELQAHLNEIEYEIGNCRQIIQNEIQKVEKYKVTSTNNTQ